MASTHKRQHSFSPRLPIDVWCRVFKGLLGVKGRPSPIEIIGPAQLINAVLSCRDSHEAWKAVVLQPEQHGLLPWIITATPTTPLVGVVLQLGLPDPTRAITELKTALHPGDDILCK